MLAVVGVWTLQVLVSVVYTAMLVLLKWAVLGRLAPGTDLKQHPWKLFW